MTGQPLLVILCHLPKKRQKGTGELLDNSKACNRGLIIFLIELGFNDMLTLVGHFVSSPKRRKEIEEIAEEMKERDREERGTGMKVKKQKK